MMLDYEKQIFLDILQENGLVIAAKGLGLDSVIVNLLKVYCDPGNLVFVLGTDGKRQEWIVSKLLMSGASPPPRVVTSELGAADREHSYLEGGVWFVPTRILVVDLIKKRIPIDLITGFVVCKGHNVLKNHQDSFVLRLFRQGNKTGFIKAFSNQAPSFMGGLSKVEQIMKALFVRNLFLWPRYHAAVKSSLAQCKPAVIELHLEMSNTMLQLQNALLDLLKLSVQELKRLNPMLDTEEVTVENAVSEAFHKVLHSQMDPVWHALSERTKSLLADLKLFHYFIMALLTHDSVSFYSIVKSQKRADRALKGSGWHLLPPAETLFTLSKFRVYGSSQPDHVTEVDPEPSPKWSALSEVLGEIHRDIGRAVKVEEREVEPKPKQVEDAMEDLFQEATPETSSDRTPVNKSEILILTREERTCYQLQLYLTLGSKELLSSQYRKLLSGRDNVGKGVGQSDEAEMQVENDENGSSPDEQDESEKLDTYTLSLSKNALSQLSQLEAEDKMVLAGCFEDSFSQVQDKSQVPTQINPTQMENSLNPPTITIKSFKKNLMYMEQILEEMQPRWVIIYDTDMTLVRQLEVYQGNHPSIRLAVYFLIYGGTIEEQSYLTSLRKEKDAFDHLILEKARIVIPEDMSDCPELLRDSSKANETVSKTRKGGLEGSPKKEAPRIIVDMREFRSELPALIHARGIEIEPLTITVGDYILTPDICLERKSVSDLIQSLNSGRLYNQALAMTRHYSRPMLLIEFDKDKPFDLQDRYYLSTDASSEHVVTKLQLLTLHFPQLRIVWSPNPHATAQLFEELKQGRPEPDVAVAVGVGVDQTATDDDKFNPSVHNLLLKLPGVTNKNIYAILFKGQSLDHLRSLSKSDLAKLLENSSDGEILYKAIHEKCDPDDSATNITAKGRCGPLRGKRKRFH